MVFFRDKVAKALNYGAVKALIIVVFAAYLAGACYGITNLQEGLERRHLSKEDSYSIRFYDLEDEYYREFPYRIQVCKIFKLCILFFRFLAGKFKLILSFENVDMHLFYS